MAANPWAREDSRAGGYRVALGGVRAFVERNQLQPDDRERPVAFSSRTLMTRIRSANERTSQLLSDVRELERLDMASSTAGCTSAQQLEERLARVAALRDQLREVLNMKPVLLQTLRKTAAVEFVDVEMDHQRTFVNLFCTIGRELPRLAHVVRTLEDLHLLEAELSASCSDYEREVADLNATIVKFQDAFDDMERLRGVYSKLQAADEGAS